jgi:hypothetical protein
MMAKRFVSDEIKSSLKGLSKEAREEILKIAEEDTLKSFYATIPKKAQEIAQLWAMQNAITKMIVDAKNAGSVPRSTTLEKIMGLPAEVAEISSYNDEDILALHDKLFKRKKRAKKTQTLENTETKTKPKRKKTAPKKA